MKYKILIGVVILTGLITAAFVMPKKAIQNPDQGENTPSTHDKKTYENASYGVSFAYPANYVLTEKNTGNAERARHSIILINQSDFERVQNDIKNGTPSDGPTAIIIDMFQNDLDKQSVENWIKNTNESNWKLAKSSLASTTLSGTRAFTYSWSGLYEGESMVFAHKNNIFMISVTYFGQTDQIRKDYNDILSSLQLM